VGGFLEVFLAFREGREEHRQAWMIHSQHCHVQRKERGIWMPRERIQVQSLNRVEVDV